MGRDTLNQFLEEKPHQLQYSGGRSPISGASPIVFGGGMSSSWFKDLLPNSDLWNTPPSALLLYCPMSIRMNL